MSNNLEELTKLAIDCAKNPRSIDSLVLHCSDTKPSQQFTLEKLQASHRKQGFGQWPGYHIYIRRDGTLHYCRPVSVIGCHVKGYNTHSIGVCYEGGHREEGERGGLYEDNRTPEQKRVLLSVFRLLKAYYPEARILGHCEFGVPKACPCLSPPASVEYAGI